MGCELEDEIWEVFKSWEVSESCQRCTGQSFSFVSRIPNDTTFKDYSACPNGSQSKKLKTGSLWNFFWLWENSIFSLWQIAPHLILWSMCEWEMPEHLVWNLLIMVVKRELFHLEEQGMQLREESSVDWNRGCQNPFPPVLPREQWQQYFITKAMWQPAGILKWPLHGN